MSRQSLTVSLIHLGVLLCAFALSVQVRSFNLNQPLGRHHEWISAHTLLTLNIWEHGGGPDAFHFSPVYTFDEPGNKNIPILGGVADQKGDYYYVSYPPLAFLAPYYTFKITGAPMTAASLQTFGLVLHFFTALLFYLLLLQLFKRSWYDNLYFPAILGYLLYLFASGHLWFHSNVYFVDVLMQFFFMAQLYVYYYVFTRNGSVPRSIWILTAVVTFCAVYTEWLGLFAAFTAFLVAAWRYFSRKEKRFLTFGLLLSGAVVLSLGCTLYAYSSIHGWDAFVQASLHKLKLRSGHAGAEGSEYGFSIRNPESYTYLRQHYDANYLHIFPLLTIFVGIYALIAVYRKKYLPGFRETGMLLLVFFPLLLHHLFFFNFNAVHDFSTLKTGTLFFLLIVIAVAKIDRFAKTLPLRIYALSTLAVVGISAAGLYKSVKHYQGVNSLATVNYYNLHVGLAIREYARPEERVFVNSWITPECMYYARRNYEQKPDITTAVAHLRAWGANDPGLFVYVDGQDVSAIYRFTVAGDSTLVWKAE